MIGLDSCGYSPHVKRTLLLLSRSSYPDHKEGQDGEVSGELPAEKDLEYDDDTMELILPSGRHVICVKMYFLWVSHRRSCYLKSL